MCGWTEESQHDGQEQQAVQEAEPDNKKVEDEEIEDDERELGEGHHDHAQQRGDGPIQDGHEHMVQRLSRAAAGSATGKQKDF